ncbi:stage V sporulation protein E [Candidatus Uhrbacteria bacterium CG_4_9_14_3_um_filter_36_7]|uniref:Probable peptidoglycan glycosyltransferase FtsW n=1 Tax=Candidatus Uhrbacteria bacterium CG_4_9_14_3_um_filter_36_7 TaxID=1975033 RepID=A0A2M7XHH6_9BACT|nr:MAG: stage V sporulation protein E [Candidatus Uhrbacteria bacterium CG_4_9_14_3_um_filter_36_7]
MTSSSHGSDYIFLGLVIFLVLFGFLMLLSASGPSGYASFGDSLYYVKHQLIFGLIPGIMGFIFAIFVPYQIWKKYAWPILLLTIVLLIFVFIPGIGAPFGTSKSWISVAGLFSIQPAEIAKLTLLFYMAAWFEERGEQKVKDLKSGFLPFLTVLGSIILLIGAQPDIGSMFVIVGMSLVVYFLAGAAWPHLFAFLAAGVGLLLLLIKLAPYRAARLTTFLYPELDPQGIGYHINQALLAIGSGGFWGLGYGHSRQKFHYLPEVFGDSIYAILAEELGFIIAVLLLIFFLYFFYRSMRIAFRSPDLFGTYLVMGIAGWIVLQAFVNIGSMLALMPMTGITLPFISYGGTSLAVCLTAVGVIFHISRYTK